MNAAARRAIKRKPLQRAYARDQFAPTPHARKSKARMTGAQRNSIGRRSEWTASPYYVNATTVDARWGRTVSDGGQ